MSRRIPAAVLGATGYVGGEFLRLIDCHPVFELHAAVSDSRAGDRIRDVFPHLAFAYTNERFRAHDHWLDALDGATELALFSAAPHGASARIIAGVLADTLARNIDLHIVDASADFRFSSADAFRGTYGSAHGAPDIISQFSSGLPEHVVGTPTAHIGNPGCFATAMLLASVPLLRANLTDGHFFVSGVTGSTGSGRVPQTGTHHPERHSNLYAYKPLAHRHAPEVSALAEQASGRRMQLHFVPHSGPFARGIYITVQARCNPGVDSDDVRQAFAEAYNDAPFVEVVDSAPRLKDVVASNRSQIGYAVEDDTVVVFCAIDNLVKGAAGGAMQWMNRLWDLPETNGLLAAAPAWV